MFTPNTGAHRKNLKRPSVLQIVFMGSLIDNLAVLFKGALEKKHTGSIFLAGLTDSMIRHNS